LQGEAAAGDEFDKVNKDDESIDIIETKVGEGAKFNKMVQLHD
jgi:hypothetical protein